MGLSNLNRKCLAQCQYHLAWADHKVKQVLGHETEYKQKESLDNNIAADLLVVQEKIFELKQYLNKYTVR